MPRMRAREGFTRGVERKTLCDRHQEILRRRALGQSPEDIATDLGVKVGVVYSVVRSDLGQERLTQLKASRDEVVANTIDYINELVPVALERVREALHGEGRMAALKNADVLKVAGDVLDRAGFGKVQRGVVEVNHGYKGRVGIDLIAEGAKRVLEGSYGDNYPNFPVKVVSEGAHGGE